MTRRKRQNNKNNKGKKLICLALILLVSCIIGFEAYRMISAYMIKKSSDNQWPAHDLTSGQYSGSYDGIDISRHQGRIHWDELSEVKRLKFIYVKATEGASIQILLRRLHVLPVSVTEDHFVVMAFCPDADSHADLASIPAPRKSGTRNPLRTGWSPVPWHGYFPLFSCGVAAASAQS